MSIRERSKGAGASSVRDEDEHETADQGSSNAAQAAQAQRMRVIRAAAAKREDLQPEDLVGAGGSVQIDEAAVATTVRLPLSALSPSVAQDLESLVNSVVGQSGQADYFHRVADAETLEHWLDTLRSYVRSALPALMARQGVDANRVAGAQLDELVTEIIEHIERALVAMLRAPVREARTSAILFQGRVPGTRVPVVVRNAHSRFDFDSKRGALELCLRFSST